MYIAHFRETSNALDASVQYDAVSGDTRISQILTLKEA